jgi:hypothetical protein
MGNSYGLFCADLAKLAATRPDTFREVLYRLGEDLRMAGAAPPSGPYAAPPSRPGWRCPTPPCATAGSPTTPPRRSPRPAPPPEPPGRRPSAPALDHRPLSDNREEIGDG